MGVGFVRLVLTKKEGITPLKVVRTMVYGQKRKDKTTGNVISERKGTSAMYRPLKDKEAELITARKRKTPQSGTGAY